MEKIDRNDPCPCGSGKKYKKCCGAGEAVSITQILEGEIDELQRQMIQFALYHFQHEIEEDFNLFEENIDIEIDDENERYFYELIHTIWFSCFGELEDGDTIMEKFIASEAGKIKRTKLRQILQTWDEPRAFAGNVISIKDNKLKVMDGFTREQLDVLIPGVAVEIEEGTFFLGIILPYEQNYVFFPAPLDLPAIKPEHAFSYIEDRSIEDEYDSAEEFLTDYFLEIMAELPMIGGMIDPSDIEWASPIYKEVADIFKAKMESLDVPPPVIDSGLILWSQFCEKKPKRIQNPKLYAAAIHDLLSTIVPMNIVFTKKELARMYEVPQGSVSGIVLEMETILSEEIAEFIGIFFDMDEELEDEFMPAIDKAPVIEFPVRRDAGPVAVETAKPALEIVTKAPRKVSRKDEERAQDLIFDALQSNGRQRYIFAEEALQLNPNCVDAYVILAENEDCLEDALILYKKGMEIGEKALDKKFFEENKGYFWGLIETRPYMRAKHHYAESLYILGKMADAIREFEELLELNPMDNQGVRSSLFIAYMDAEKYGKACTLLEEYDEETTDSAYNKLLLELMENGFTVNAKKLLKEAKKANKFLPTYLTGKKHLPNELPDFYGFGDEDEAISYAGMHLHLWEKIEGLAEWIKK